MQQVSEFKQLTQITKSAKNEGVGYLFIYFTNSWGKNSTVINYQLS
jgi:hypothetical protein